MNKTITRMKCHNIELAISQEFVQQDVDLDKLAKDLTAYNKDGTKCAIIYDNQGVVEKKYYVIVLEKLSIIPADTPDPVILWQVSEIPDNR